MNKTVTMKRDRKNAVCLAGEKPMGLTLEEGIEV